MTVLCIVHTVFKRILCNRLHSYQKQYNYLFNFESEADFLQFKNTIGQAV